MRTRFGPTVFIAIYDESAAENAMFRQQAFDWGVNMVAHDTDSLCRTLSEAVLLVYSRKRTRISREYDRFDCRTHDCRDSRDSRRYCSRDNGSDQYRCPYCGLDGLSEREMWFHCPAFHINCPNDEESTHRQQCPICREVPRDPMQVLHRTASIHSVSIYVMSCHT